MLGPERVMAGVGWLPWSLGGDSNELVILEALQNVIRIVLKRLGGGLQLHAAWHVWRPSGA